MDQARRTILKSASALGMLSALGLISESVALAAEGPVGFDAKNLAAALAAIGGKAVDSTDITLTAPEIAEDAAVVPLGVVSTIPNTQAIYILVEKNPNPLLASFTIPPGTDANMVAHAKMVESSRVFAVVKADGKLYSTSREIKVTFGDCVC